MDRTEADGLGHALAVARMLATGADPRATICDAARRVAAADWTALVERDEDALRITAAEGLCQGVLRGAIGLERSGSGHAFASGDARFSPDAAADPLLDQRLVAATGSGAVLHQPVRHSGSVVGVLVVGWAQPRRRPEASLWRLLELLALYAAIALERDSLVATLAVEARTDPLTGLANRRHWQDQAARDLRRASRHGLAATLALIDLDDFKRFNDTYGHAAGDELLRTTAANWRAQLRESDLLARVGGDEFALLAVANVGEDLDVVVERLRAALPPGASCSAGWVAAGGDVDLDQLTIRADAALYRAKGAGKGRVAAADPLMPGAQTTSRRRPLSTS
ncbi:GGDEF domain-containing protein [Conexibacter sp. JD483]|uniref:GGDEF domain-containing protein n=1 Tax=unclassified Conexibacter TaxID=2627773 RepID=UPI00271FB830|nr:MULTISPECIES: GGDEF domain-containing protein [unclassified Conexibacter]MDO8186347.1 GGDEF domain-containing protein [Conexibacter sp. CPCC 205706]MDO8197552.1 GGDEF domain-containing protein [Conexibacter sp. CPCC 205762]MDR9369626.1 GGDEF domain-containing protein [Conexibacter sp. JD483]